MKPTLTLWIGFALVLMSYACSGSKTSGAGRNRLDKTSEAIQVKAVQDSIRLLNNALEDREVQIGTLKGRVAELEIRLGVAEIEKLALIRQMEQLSQLIRPGLPSPSTKLKRAVYRTATY